jgi:hypothetical protein
METVLVSFLVEDVLCENLARKLLTISKAGLAPGVCYMANGYGYIKKNLTGFNKAASGVPLFVLCDLVGNCPVTQIKKWLPFKRNPNLIFRIAIKESESWILADRDEFAAFLGISKSLIPSETDKIINPKELLIKLASKSHRKELRLAIVPKSNSTATIGPDYNSRLSEFINNSWDPNRASQHSVSLNRAIRSIQTYSPIIQH